MTRDDIIRMAKEAGSDAFKYPSMISEEDWQVLERFAKLVRNDYSNKHAQLWLKRIDEAIQAEREACAKVCESLSLEWEDQPEIAQAELATMLDCALAIRARGGEEARIKRLEKYLIRRTI
jgi:Trp operon repressor